MLNDTVNRIRHINNPQGRNRSKDGTVGYCASFEQELPSSIPGSYILVSTSFSSL